MAITSIAVDSCLLLSTDQCEAVARLREIDHLEYQIGKLRAENEEKSQQVTKETEVSEGLLEKCRQLTRDINICQHDLRGEDKILGIRWRGYCIG